METGTLIDQESLFPPRMLEAGKRRILVVDDEEPVRKVLYTHLSKEGYLVVPSRGGMEVYEELSCGGFDVVVSDIRMPGVDGMDVLRYMRARFDSIPVIMLTGLTDVGVAVEVMKKGAYDFIMKPVRKDDLLNAIRRALVHRDLLVRNRTLETENRAYQASLEKKVEERTRQLDSKTEELEAANAALKTMNGRFISVLAETIEAKDLHTRGHCNRMRRICAELGRLTGMDAKELETLEYASLLHDLGKVGVKEAVLNKPGPLTDEEAVHLRTHPGIGGKILNGVPLMERVAEIITAHHENYDGSGYPRGLKGDEIPLEARIIAVADVFDAMWSDRPYRKGLPTDVIVEEMKRVAGAQLDPGLVELFLDNRLHIFNISGA